MKTVTFVQTGLFSLINVIVPFVELSIEIPAKNNLLGTLISSTLYIASMIIKKKTLKIEL